MMFTYDYSDTSARSCDKPCIRSNRLRACEAPPVLRTDLRPDSIFERIEKIRVWQDSEERAMGIQGNLLAREADTTFRPSDVSKTEVETSSRRYNDAKFPQGFKPTSDILKSNQDLDSRGVESKDTIMDDVPVELQPRYNVKSQHPTEAIRNVDFWDRLQIDAESKEVLKKQQKEIREMSFTLKAVLELQVSILQDLQRNIEAIMQEDSQEKFNNIPSSICDHRTLVKRFKPQSCDTSSYAKAFMATPKKKNPKDTSCSSVENSDSDGTSSESDAGQEAEASDESF